MHTMIHNEYFISHTHVSRGVGSTEIVRGRNGVLTSWDLVLVLFVAF